MQGILETTRETGYTIVLCTHDNAPEKEEQALRTLRRQRIKGLLITPAAGYVENEDNSYLRASLRALDVPTVLIDRAVKMPAWDGIYYDNYNGAYLAVEHIIRKGYTDIGCMVSDLALQIGKDRLRGMQQAIADHHISLNCDAIYQDASAVYVEKSYEMSKCWTERGCLAKAMFFSNGSLAKGFIKACLEKGLRLGEDVYCVGFDYVDILEMLPLKYAFLDRDAINMGRIATKMLMDHFGQTIATRREYIIPASIITTSGDA